MPPRPSTRLVKNVYVDRQNRINHFIGYDPVKRNPRVRDTLSHLRVKPFREYQPEFDPEGRLSPPVRWNPERAKLLAESQPGYPVFDGGEVERYAPNVGAIIAELDSAVHKIVEESSDIYDQGDAKQGIPPGTAQQIADELERFKKLARKAYASTVAAEALTEEAYIVAERTAIYDHDADDNQEQKHPEHDALEPEAEPLSKPERPRVNEKQQIKAERAVTRANIALARAKDAAKASKKAAKDAVAMRESLERLNALVRDAGLTAAGLPDHLDDAADRRVSRAQQEYSRAYEAAAAIYKDPNRRLNWAFGIKIDAEKSVKAAKEFKASILKRTPAKDRLDKDSPELRAARAAERKRTLAELEQRGLGGIGRFTSAWRRLSKQGQRHSPRTDGGVDIVTNIDTVRIPRKPYARDQPQFQGARPYQTAALEQLEKSDADALVVAPTGSGKTYIFTRYLKNEANQGKKIAVLAHQNTLISQITQEIKDATGKEPGLVHGEKKDFSQPVTVISHGTVVENPNKAIPNTYRPDIVIIDEAHHAASKGYREILRRLDAGRVLGFTATPNHPGGEPLVGYGGPFDERISTVTTAELVQQGYLVQPTFVDVDVRDKEGNKVNINQARNTGEEMARAVVAARRAGRSHILVFAGSATDAGLIPTEVVQNINAAIPEGIIPHNEVLGATDKETREQVIRRFNNDETGVLINYGTLNEGFDSPKVDAIILGRNVGNPGTLAQIIGRGMRRPKDNPNAKKDVLVFNYSDETGEKLKEQVFGQTELKQGRAGRPPSRLAGASLTPARAAERDDRPDIRSSGKARNYRETSGGNGDHGTRRRGRSGRGRQEHFRRTARPKNGRSRGGR